MPARLARRLHHDGPESRLALIDAVLARGDPADYRLAHSARADLRRRLGRTAETRISHKRTLDLARREPERRFLERRLGGLGDWHGKISMFKVGTPLSIFGLAKRPTYVTVV